MLTIYIILLGVQLKLKPALGGNRKSTNIQICGEWWLRVDKGACAKVSSTEILTLDIRFCR